MLPFGVGGGDASVWSGRVGWSMYADPCGGIFKFKCFTCQTHISCSEMMKYMKYASDE